MRAFLGCPDAYIVSTGPELGTRESRHVVARYRLTEDDVLGAACVDDAVAVGAWPIEYHPGPGIPSQWRFISGRGCFDIPLGALCSLDTDRGAGASVRVMGTAFATGQPRGWPPRCGHIVACSPKSPPCGQCSSAKGPASPDLDLRPGPSHLTLGRKRACDT
jgi:hypothetical protein